MTDTVQLAVVAGVVGFIAGFPAWLVSVRAAAQSVENGKKAEETAKKVDAVKAVANEIHTLTDGNLSKTTNALEVSTTLNKTLQSVIDGMVETKRQDDAAKATAGLVAKIPDAPKA